jgi:hypothetical protein
LLTLAERAFHLVANARILRINSSKEHVIPAGDTAEVRHVQQSAEEFVNVARWWLI